MVIQTLQAAKLTSPLRAPDAFAILGTMVQDFKGNFKELARPNFKYHFKDFWMHLTSGGPLLFFYNIIAYNNSMVTIHSWAQVIPKAKVLLLS